MIISGSRLPAASKPITQGTIDPADEGPLETAEVVMERMQRSLQHAPPHPPALARACAMKYLPGECAFGKLRALAGGVAQAHRPELDRPLLAGV